MRPEESFVSNAVRSLQTMLRVAAAGEGREISVIPDGIYGRQTMNEVAAFQRKHGLPVTGVADQPTWEIVVASYDDALPRVDRAELIEVILNPNQVIRQGEENPAILLAQGMLMILHKAYAVAEPSLSGRLDLATAESLRHFQCLSGLPETGELDKITWKQLALQFPLASNL